MSDLTFDSSTVCELLHHIADTLYERAEEVRVLDATIGDGDLGVTVGLMAKALNEFADSTEETDMGKLLAHCGLAINRANPSTFGTIMASAFIGAGKAVPGKTTLDLADLVAAGQAAVEAVKNRGKAEVGDKTVLDSLVPAVEALADEHQEGNDLGTAIRAAARASKEGMEATTAMIAKHGRARIFGEKSIGVQDGGATVMYYVVTTVADYIDTR